MEEFVFNTDKGETVDTIQFETIKIEQNGIKYELNIEVKENMINFSIKDRDQFPSINYNREMSFKEIKELNNVFCILKSFKDFYDYLNSLSENKKLNIRKSNNKISIILLMEVLLKQQTLEIDLFPKKNNIDIKVKEIYEELLNIKENMKEIIKENENLKINDKLKTEEIINLKKEENNLKIEIDSLKNDNKELKKEINNLRNEIKELNQKFEKNDKKIDIVENIRQNYETSVIMSEEERKIIFSEIENKINKQIKTLKRLYQATVDGGDSKIFHRKCDNIPNTLVLIKSEGLRRFGGFTHIPWKSEGGYKTDPEMKTFVFSLDKKKYFN